MKNYVKIARDEGGVIECGEGKDPMPDLPQENKNVCKNVCYQREFNAFLVHYDNMLSSPRDISCCQL